MKGGRGDCFCGLNEGCAVDCPLAAWNYQQNPTNRFGYLRRLVSWYRLDKKPLPRIWWFRVEGAASRTS